MSSRSFKQKKYGKVKPVKKVAEQTAVKPQALDLRFHYRELQTANDAEMFNHIANIVRWYETLVIWQLDNKKKVPQTTTQAKTLITALQEKRAAQGELSATRQLAHFVTHIGLMEKYATNMVNSLPSIKASMLIRKEKMKKVQVQVERIAPRFEKLVHLLYELFPRAGMEIEVLPHITDGAGKELGWKYEQSLNRLFYSKKRALEMVKMIRKDGILRVAITEAYVIARSQSFAGVRDGNYIYNNEACLINVEKLMHGVVDWAMKGPKPKRLVRFHKPKKEKKVAA